MKVLLVAVNAKYIHSNLAVRDLAAYAWEHAADTAVELEVVEYTINQQEDEILADLYRRHADLVAISCYIWNMGTVKRLAENLRKICPAVPLWLGGPEVTYDAAALLEAMPYVTGIMVGEGELTFTRLLRAYASADIASAAALREVTGIVYREQMGDELHIRTNPVTEPVVMDDIPFFYAELPEFHRAAARDVSKEEWVSAVTDKTSGEALYAHRILYYESSRGCPFRCSYCLSSVDQHVRFRSLHKVLPELQFFLDAKVPQVKFVDRTFNCDHRHAMGIWSYLKEHDNGVTNFHFEIAADLLREDELELLATLRPGQVQLEIGVQSTNPLTLQSIDRVQHMEHLRSVVDRIHEGRNIHQHLDLIVGLPFEDLESFARSFDEVYAMRPQQLQLGFLKVLRGSAMHRAAEQYGICYHADAPYEVLYTNWIDYADVIRLKGIEEMVEVYYNSLQFPHTIRTLIARVGSAFETFDRLAAYYERQGLNGRSHSRLDRFRILREFAQEIDPERSGYYDEVLVYDLYLRENSKSRPEWAREESAYKAEFQTYFRQEAGSRVDRRMMHGEVFAENVGGFSGEGPWKVVFDYRKRDPLTGNAAVIQMV